MGDLFTSYLQLQNGRESTFRDGRISVEKRAFHVIDRGIRFNRTRVGLSISLFFLPGGFGKDRAKNLPGTQKVKSVRRRGNFKQVMAA